MVKLNWEKIKYLSKDVKGELFYIPFKYHNYENSFEAVFTKDYWYSLVKGESKETIEDESEDEKEGKGVKYKPSIILKKTQTFFRLVTIWFSYIVTFIIEPWDAHLEILLKSIKEHMDDLLRKCSFLNK